MNLTKLKRLNEIMCEKHLFVWNIKKDSNMMATATIKLAELLPFSLLHRRRKWQPPPVFLPRESPGQRSLVGCCP